MFSGSSLAFSTFVNQTNVNGDYQHKSQLNKNRISKVFLYSKVSQASKVKSIRNATEKIYICDLSSVKSKEHLMGMPILPDIQQLLVATGNKKTNKMIKQKHTRFLA